MIVKNQSGVSVTSTMAGEAFTAGIDDEDMAHIIGLFTDLYSDPEGAVIREYSTNGRDATIEAGSNEPIHVTLPSSLSPFFKVKDYGIGLDAEGVKAVYSRYGRSTKRDSNDFNGALGLGCKSALTYAEQFTVESVKDGVKTICSISRESAGVPVFTVVGSFPTDERNGTEITVPVRRYNEMQAKAAAFFAQGWPAGSVLVNGAEPKRTEGLDLGDGLMIVEARGWQERNKHLIVMGGVAYPLDVAEFNPGLPQNYNLIAEVPIGAVNFTPSRESLMYTRTTKATLAALKPKLATAIQKSIQAKIESAGSRRDAIKQVKAWKGLIGGRDISEFKYQGKHFPSLLAGSYTCVELNSRKMSAHNFARQGLSMEWVPNTLFFYGYDVTTWTATHKRKLVQFLESRTDLADYSHFAFADAKPDATWVPSDQQIAWDLVKAQKLPRNAVNPRTGHASGSFDMYWPDDNYASRRQAADLDTSKPIVYFRAHNRSESFNYAQALRVLYPTGQFVCVPENRIAKFMRELPAAVSFYKAIQDAYKAWVKSIPSDARIVMQMENLGIKSAFTSIDGAAIDDPAMVKAIDQANTIDTTNHRAAEQKFRNVSHVVGDLREDLADASWVNPLDEYPLLADLGSTNLGHPDTVLYINTKYNG